MHKLKFLLIISLALLSFSCSAQITHPVYIRANQVGYLPNDFKTAVAFSKYPVEENQFNILNKKDGEEVYSGKLEISNENYGDFKYCYTLNFSRLNKNGNYEIEIGKQKSFAFSIGNKIFDNIADSLLLFFKVQRCGPTNPLMHKPCHLSDVSRLVGDPNYHGAVDVTGGWHDAGDYIKFLSTTAYATYMMIFSYEFDPVKYGFDDNHDGVPDLLAEAKIGLDWLLRCNYSKYKLITQVQNLRDHDVGWRMPSADTLRYDRPGYVSMGKNQIGIFTAVMAIASRVWADKFQKYDFSQKCLQAAENIYSIRNDVPNIDSTKSGFYQDNAFWGKMALGAVELYTTTKKYEYFIDAKTYADSAGSDYWWSWGNINSLADYKIAKYEPRFADYILNNLKVFNAKKDSSVFREGMPYVWGTTNSLLGISLQAILYKTLTGSHRFDSLEVYERDYVLGRNPWGLSFIYNIGTMFPKHLHNQIAYFHNGYLPGGLSAGAAPENILKEFDIKRSNNKYTMFNTDSIKYYDDRNDYITNEPTITGNATAIFVYGYFSNR